MHNCSEKIREMLRKRIGFLISKNEENKLGVRFSYDGKKFIILAFPDSPDVFPSILTFENTEVTPHISETEYDWDGEKARLLCLLEKENYIASHISFYDKVDFVLDQFERLMNLSKRQIIIEMQKEFMYYWNSCANNNLEYQLYVSSNITSQKLDILYIRDKENSKKMKTVIIKNFETELNNFYSETGIQGKALFIPISNLKGIIPPHKQGLWNKNVLLKIIQNQVHNNISPANFRFIKKYRHKGDKLHIVFSMEIPGGFEIMFVLKLKFYSSKNDYLISKIQNSLRSLEYIYSNRFDLEYMKNRIGLNPANNNRQLLLAGLGSLGSYIAREMPKIGLSNLTLLDPDTFNTGNVLRHTLATHHHGYSKVNALRFELERHYPELKVHSSQVKLNQRYIDENDIKKYNIIIIAVGNTDSQLEINRCLYEINYKGLVVFTWLEPMGVGSHSLVIDYSKAGCYNCLFKNEDGSIISNKASFINSSDQLTIANGCGGSFAQYGNIILLETTAQVTDIVSRYCQGEHFDENHLISRKMTNFKGDYDFTERYLKLNGKYLYETEFISKGCEICAK